MNIREIEDNPQLRKLNLACGKDIRPASLNWLNVDMVSGPGVDKLDVFSLPWPYESDHFDYILAKHILEHVPHNIPQYGYHKNFFQQLVEEMWRVMKVGGTLDVISPGGLKILAGAMDHKRFIMPETFHVFYPGDKWSYYTDCRFELAGERRSENWRFRLLKKCLQRGFNIDISQLRTHEVRFQLRKLPAAVKHDGK
jgi:SAM-dependent methyltransferase